MRSLTVPALPQLVRIKHGVASEKNSIIFGCWNHLSLARYYISTEQ